MFLHCDNEVQMCCCCCSDPLPVQAEGLSYLFNHLKLRWSNPPLPKSFLAHVGGGQDTRQTRQTPPPTSGSSPPVFVRLSPSSHMPRRFIFIAHATPTTPLFFCFLYPLHSSASPFFSRPLALFLFFASSSVQPQLV